MSKVETAGTQVHGNSKSLEGKVAVVTGASSGIGEATARALAAAGARLSLLARRVDRLTALTDELAQCGSEGHIHIETDVSKEEKVSQAIEQTLQKFGRIDILVNNAGVMYLGPVNGANTSDWRRMFDINVLGLMSCTHAVLPTMIQQKSGHIVNISSVSGKIVSSRSAAYSATKFAVGAFSDGLRQEVASAGIRVTTIEPGAVATELTDHITDSNTKKSVKDWVAGMRPLQGKDIANAIVYVCAQPEWVNINEVLIRPTDQTF